MSEDLKDLIGKLKANGKVMGLVKLMKPMDVVAVISTKMELCDRDAKFVTKNLLQHKESYINNLGALVPDIKRYHFPPDPIEEPGQWPYDDMTKAAMDPHNKGKKRPLMTSLDPLDIDPQAKDQSGTSDSGLYLKSPPHAQGNSMPVSGRSFDKRGTPGWSASPPGKEFELPDNIDVTKPSPVGSPIPNFFGGRNPDRRMGFRRK
jgi:hypothetical protein